MVRSADLHYHKWSPDLERFATAREHKGDLPYQDHVDLVPRNADRRTRLVIMSEAREVEKTEVEEMLRFEVIEPASTEWSSPVVIVPKPDGRWRFCVDYRRLNALVPQSFVPAASHG